MELPEVPSVKVRCRLCLYSRHRSRQREEKMKRRYAWDDGDLIFPNEIGKSLGCQNVVRRSLKRLLMKAELLDIRFHDLRHTSASLLLHLREHPKIVQERLGHSTITTTMDFYSHMMPDLQR